MGLHLSAIELACFGVPFLTQLSESASAGCVVADIFWCGARVRGTKTLKTLHFKSFLVDQLRVVSCYF